MRIFEICHELQCFLLWQCALITCVRALVCDHLPSNAGCWWWWWCLGMSREGAFSSPWLVFRSADEWRKGRAKKKKKKHCKRTASIRAQLVFNLLIFYDYYHRSVAALVRFDAGHKNWSPFLEVTCLEKLATTDAAQKRMFRRHCGVRRLLCAFRRHLGKKNKRNMSTRTHKIALRFGFCTDKVTDEMSDPSMEPASRLSSSPGQARRRGASNRETDWVWYFFVFFFLLCLYYFFFVSRPPCAEFGWVVGTVDGDVYAEQHNRLHEITKWAQRTEISVKLDAHLRAGGGRKKVHRITFLARRKNESSHPLLGLWFWFANVTPNALYIRLLCR